MSKIDHGPGAPCRRTACVEERRRLANNHLSYLIDSRALPPADIDARRREVAEIETGDHLGGAHLNPHDRQRFDGVHISHVTYRVRDDLQALLAVRKQHPDLAEIIDTAVVRAVEEIDRLGQEVAHVRVDADRQIRHHLQLGESCEYHGRQIKELSQQLHAIDEAEQRTNGGRLALLGLLQAVRDWVAAMRQRQQLDQPLPSIEEVINGFEKAARKTSAAHDQAWQKRKPKKREEN